MQTQEPYFANKQAVKAAFNNFVLPSIRHAMENGLLKRQSLFILVARPGVPYAEGCSLETLFEYSLGEEEPFHSNAIGKAVLSWRTGLPSADVIFRHQHLLEPGDCRLPGSAVLHGYIASASGADPEHDEMFSEMTISAARAAAAIATRQFLAQEDPPRFLR